MEECVESEHHTQLFKDLAAKLEDSWAGTALLVASRGLLAGVVRKLSKIIIGDLML